MWHLTGTMGQNRIRTERVPMEKGPVIRHQTGIEGANKNIEKYVICDFVTGTRQVPKGTLDLITGTEKAPMEKSPILRYRTGTDRAKDL